MSSILIPGQWQEQPQYPVDVDYSRIGRGIVCALNPAAGLVDLSYKKTAFSLIGTSVRQVATPVGLGIGAFTNASYVAFNNPCGGLDTAATVFALVLNGSTSNQGFWTLTDNASSGHQDHYPYSGTLYISALGSARHCSGISVGSVNLLQPSTFAVARKAGVSGSYYPEFRSYLNGQLINTTTTGISEAASGSAFRLGSNSQSAEFYSGSFILFLMWNRELSEIEIKSLHSDPWQIFRKAPQILYFDVGGGSTQNLAATAAAVAAATGALTQSVPLAAAALSLATATGALSVSIPLAGAASAQASATGGLSLSIPLAGAAVAQALAQAGLTHAVPLAGSAAALAAASGALSLNISLSGSAIALAAASADLTVQAAGHDDLAATAAAVAAASGALTLVVPLSGAALTIASASGGITHIVPLTGSAASASMATGGLDVSVSLNAAALAQALASATLTVQGGLAGNAAAIAAAAASLTLRVNLDGNAVANAIASGALTTAGLIVSGTPGWEIDATARDWTINRDTRTWRISA